MELHPILERDSAGPAPGLWHVLSAVGDAPSMRVGHTATHVRLPGDETGRGKVYFIGGADPDRAYGDVCVLDLDRLSWDRVDEPGDAAPSPGAAVSGAGAATAFASGSVFRPRYEHVAFVPASLPTEIFVLAGADKVHNLEDDAAAAGGGLSVQSFDVVTLRWRTVKAASGSAQPPSARTHHATAALGDCCYLFSGGHSGAEAVGDRRVHRFDAAARSWSAPDTRGEPPSPRHGHALAVTADGTLYVHGGMAGPKLYDDLHALDLCASSPSWKPVGGRRKARRPAARAAHSAVAIGQRVYVFGGMNGTGEALDDLWQFDACSGAWTELAVALPPPAPRLDFAACLVPWTAASSSADEASESAADVTASAAESSAAAAVAAIALGDDAVCAKSAPEVGAGDVVPKPATSLLLLINGGMDTQGEIFDDTLVFKLPS